jgi:hypothetical protein
LNQVGHFHGDLLDVDGQTSHLVDEIRPRGTSHSFQRGYGSGPLWVYLQPRGTIDMPSDFFWGRPHPNPHRRGGRGDPGAPGRSVLTTMTTVADAGAGPAQQHRRERGRARAA